MMKILFDHKGTRQKQEHSSIMTKEMKKTLCNHKKTPSMLPSSCKSDYFFPLITITLLLSSSFLHKNIFI